MRTIVLPTRAASPAGNNLPWPQPARWTGQVRSTAIRTPGAVVLLALLLLLFCGALPAISAQGQIEEFVFETRTVRYILGSNGRTISLLDKSIGKERLGNKTTPFAQVHIAGKTWPVTSLQREGDTLLAKFGGSKVQARYRILARDTHLTVELSAVEGAQPESIELCRLQSASLQRTGSVLVVKWDEDFAICLMALSERVHSQVMGKDTLAASVYPEFGMVGEKVALIAVPTTTFLNVVQEVEKTYGLPSPSIGGVWAKQSPDVDTNYLFVDVSKETADQVIAYARMGGFRYVLIPWRSWAASTGSYPINRKNFPKGEESLKATIDRFHAAGLKVGMHMMTSLISKSDPLVRPTPDPRLLKDAATSLAKDIDARATTITAGDDLAAFVDEGRQHDEGVDRGIDIKIDDEILFCMATLFGGTHVFSNCRRGAYGTTKKAHKAWTPVYRLAQGAAGYVADLKTSLKDQIADRVADIVNQCGFDMIYFDGGELNRANGPFWYYVGQQQTAIWQRLKRDVLFQGSGMTHWLWHILARGTCDDHAAIAVKAYMDYHKLKRLEHNKDNFFPSELGWCGLLVGGPDHPATTVDDMEHYGARMIAHDVPISIQTSLKQLERNPQSGDILAGLNKIDAFRRSGVISESQREQLETGNWSLLDASGKISVRLAQPVTSPPPRQKVEPAVSVSDGRILFRGNIRLPSDVPANQIPGAMLCSINLTDREAKAKDCSGPEAIDGDAPPRTPQDLLAGKALTATIRISGQREYSSPPYPVLNIQLEDQRGWYRDHFIDLDFVGEKAIILPDTNVQRLLPEFGRPIYKLKRALRYFDYSKVTAINLRWMRQPGKGGLPIFLKKISTIASPTSSDRAARNAR